MACLMAALFLRCFSGRYFFATSQSSYASDAGTMTVIFPSRHSPTTGARSVEARCFEETLPTIIILHAQREPVFGSYRTAALPASPNKRVNPKIP